MSKKFLFILLSFSIFYCNESKVDASEISIKNEAHNHKCYSLILSDIEQTIKGQDYYLIGHQKNIAILKKIITDNKEAIKDLDKKISNKDCDSNQELINRYNSHLFPLYRANWLLSQSKDIPQKEKSLFFEEAQKIKSMFLGTKKERYQMFLNIIERFQLKLERIKNRNLDTYIQSVKNKMSDNINLFKGDSCFDEIVRLDAKSDKKDDEINAREAIKRLSESLNTIPYQTWLHKMYLENKIQIIFSKLENHKISQDIDIMGFHNPKLRSILFNNIELEHFLNKIHKECEEIVDFYQDLSTVVKEKDSIENLLMVKSFVGETRYLSMLKTVAINYISLKKLQEADKISNIILKTNDGFEKLKNHDLRELIAVVKNLNGSPYYLSRLIHGQKAILEKKKKSTENKPPKEKNKYFQKNHSLNVKEEKSPSAATNARSIPSVNQGALQFIKPIKSQAQEKQEKLQRHLDAQKQRNAEKNKNESKKIIKSEARPKLKSEKKRSFSKKENVLEFLKAHSQCTIETEFPNLPTAAKKVYQEIQNQTWKITRKQLLNLFQGLGCKRETVKGNHQRLSLPSLDKITLENGTLITLLFDENHQDILFGKGSVVFPKWNHSNTVPHYLRDQIQIALDKILAHKILFNQYKKQAISQQAKN